ncbi:tyrosine-type recombinase/integrase [Cronobacter dublinensis]|uniref:tyrosine-type recombinase/integrase n=1 Tax=Cronobacter dublinensis TaxID=413497 RepID=UPI000D00A571|nr:tyrosine-type recombinase/integrase [Cronobacter dublinensis]
MLTDTKLKNLKPRDALYKVADRDGLYVAVTKTGVISFRYDYRINGRRETLTIGKYGADGISLAQARDELIAAKKMVSAGISPASQKRDSKRLVKDAETFSSFIGKYMHHVTLADSTRAMKMAIINRDIVPVIGRKIMAEITPSMIRSMCDRILARGGNATAIQALELVNSVYRFANDRGHGFINPAQDIKSKSLATFRPRERSLSPQEMGIFLRELDRATAMATMKLAIRLIALTLVRKSEALLARWDEVNVKARTWTIPAARMKSARPHVIYLSNQAVSLIEEMKLHSCGSELLLPGRYSLDRTLSPSALNVMLPNIVNRAKEAGEDISHFTVHDLRRTGSTLLHEAGYPSDWIEKALAHEQRGVRAVYNKAEYGRQREYMLQQWADMLDSWKTGAHYDLVPFSPARFEKWIEEK